MPMPAAAIANHVRIGTCSPRNIFPAIAAHSGITPMMKSALATVVRLSATMKQMNIAAQHRLDTNPAQPIASSLRGALAPCCASMNKAITTPRKRERQKAASQPLLTELKRVATPAVLHRKVQSSSTAMPSRCSRTALRAAGLRYLFCGWRHCHAARAGLLDCSGDKSRGLGVLHDATQVREAGVAALGNRDGLLDRHEASIDDARPGHFCANLHQSLRQSGERVRLAGREQFKRCIVARHRQ